MAGFIIWIMIIIAVVAINKSNVRMRNSARSRGTGFPAGGSGGSSSAGSQGTAFSGGSQRSAGPVKKEADPWASYQYSEEKGKQQALKERLAQKYNRPVSTSSQGGDILSRAKASVEEDFGQTWEQEEAQRRQQQEQKERQRQAKEQQARQKLGQQAARERQNRSGQQTAKERQNWPGQQAKEQPAAAGWAQSPDEMLEREQGQNTLEMILDGGLSVDPRRFMGQEENPDLNAVWDLMVKGPDLELTFERDFIAEGVELLNRIQA